MSTAADPTEILDGDIMVSDVMKFASLAFLGLAVLLSFPVLSGVRDPVELGFYDSTPLDFHDVPMTGTVEFRNMPLEGGGSKTVTLTLERFQVFGKRTQITLHDDRGAHPMPAPGTAYFRGTVKDESGSLAMISVTEQGDLRGLVQTRHGHWIVGGDADDPATPFFLETVQLETDLLANSALPFECANEVLTELTDPAFDERPVVDPSATKAVMAKALQTQYVATVAIETDHEFYNKFGSGTAAAEYIGDLIAYASTLYSAELGVKIEAGPISLWATAADPWPQFSGTFCGLMDFGYYWNANRTHVERTFSHFLSGQNLGGGIAWVGVLCSGPFNYSLVPPGCAGLPASGSFGGDYGFTANISGSFNINNPAPVWDIVAFAHEVGHNFSSPHTHCYAGIGGSNPVDACYETIGCYMGDTSLPGIGSLTGGQAGSGAGTIMSYCHQRSGGMSNIDLTLGRDHDYGIDAFRVPDRMRAHVESRASYYPSCLPVDDQSGCENDVAVSGPLYYVGVEAVEAIETISTFGSVVVRADSSVTYDAGLSISLGAGFRVEQGGDFSASIADGSCIN